MRETGSYSLYGALSKSIFKWQWTNNFNPDPFVPFISAVGLGSLFNIA